jgi:type VI protein secretion system component VasF
MDLQELRKQEAELKALEEKKRREMEELPKKLEARRIKQQEMTALRAALTATDDVFGPARIRKGTTRKQGKNGRMTRTEERSARTQFLLLCGVLAVLLFLLWKSLP